MLAVVVAIVAQLLLPSDLAARPIWLLPSIEILLVAAFAFASDSFRITGYDRTVRRITIALIVAMTIANTVSAGRLIFGLVSGRLQQDPPALLVTGGGIWATNVIVFALWYWELDQGGPGTRARRRDERVYPDFVFPQQNTPELVPEGWAPYFTDYLYLSFTNAAAFSPTDVMPYARWAKMTMMGQSAVSLAVVALVIARAINILR